MRPDGQIVGLRELGVGEAFVVAQVEIGLGAVVGDEDLAVLERAHRAGIDVQVRIEFLQRDPQPAAFEQAADRRRGDPFPEGTTTPPVTKMYLAMYRSVRRCLFTGYGGEQLRTPASGPRAYPRPGFVFGFDHPDPVAVFERPQLLQPLGLFQRPTGSADSKQKSRR